MLSDIYINQLYELAPQTSTARFYITRYIKLINHFLSLNRQKQKHKTAVHHIIPRSWGGSNDKSNLVTLTHREHFIVHMCLYMTKDVNMVRAFWIIMNTGSLKGTHINSMIYASLREEYLRQNSGAESSTAKPVINLHTKQIFGCSEEASSSLGFFGRCVTTSINKKQKCGGYFWAYVDPTFDDIHYSILLDLLELRRKIVYNRRQHKAIKQQSERGKASRKMVLKKETGEVYQSCHLASLLHGLDKHSVGHAIRCNNGAVLNYHFEYVDQKYIDEHNMSLITATRQQMLQLEADNKEIIKRRKESRQVSVRIVELNMIFKNSREASLYIGAHKNAVSSALRTGHKVKGYTVERVK